MEERWKGGQRMGGAYIRIYVCQEGMMTSSLLWREGEERATAKIRNGQKLLRVLKIEHTLCKFGVP